MNKNIVVCIFTIVLSAFCVGCNNDSCEEMGFIDDLEQQSIDFFDEIVMTDEDSGTARPLKRWEDPMKIYVANDLPMYLDSSLVHVVDTLNSLMSFSGVEIEDDESKSNAKLYYMTPSEFSLLTNLSDPLPSHLGGRIQIWHNEYVINRALIFISSETSEIYSIHVLYEEITQGLGPISDTPNNENTIFSQSYPSFPNDEPQLFPIDKELIKNLYSDFLQPGMTSEEVKQELKEHYLCN
ncbi:MAG: hypothetical protein ACJATI_005263 [Halioglobus sp.]|jgi:hypothetical protein